MVIVVDLLTLKIYFSNFCLRLSLSSIQSKTFSKLLTSFRWEYEAPFQLSPERGLLNPDQEYQMTVVFRPQEAQSYQKPATCNFGDEGREENCCTLLLQGQGTETIE